MKSSKAFILIELLIVVAIISTLAAIQGLYQFVPGKEARIQSQEN